MAPTQTFNDTLIKILNLSQTLQTKVYGFVDPEFKSKRRGLAAALSLDYDCAIKTLGPVLDAYSEDINKGNIEIFLMMSYTQHADEAENKAAIEKYTVQSKKLYESATPAQIAEFVANVQLLLACYYEFFARK
jgi:hypothetical protein